MGKSTECVERHFDERDHRRSRRLTDEQIITVSDKEVALQIIPEGSEFLMRWRYSDLRRCLYGETVPPGAVFNAVHDLFRRNGIVCFE